MQEEILCYQNGTYTLPYVKDYNPFGNRTFTEMQCNSCGIKKPISTWIAHSVHRSESNPDSTGSYGNYAQVSYYCKECYTSIAPYARQNWDANKQSTCHLL